MIIAARGCATLSSSVVEHTVALPPRDILRASLSAKVTTEPGNSSRRTLTQEATTPQLTDNSSRQRLGPAQPV
jgi:hypothetical protein